MPRTNPHSIEMRIRARLAWNGWEDTPLTRRTIASQEAKDPYSAAAWDRVVDAITDHAFAVALVNGTTREMQEKN